MGMLEHYAETGEKRGAIYRVPPDAILAALRAYGLPVPEGALLMDMRMEAPPEGPVKLKVWHESMGRVEEGQPYPEIDLE